MDALESTATTPAIAPDAADDAGVDGRSRRRERNRDNVLDAVLALFEEGVLEPSIEAIATRADVSNRSIYRYFEDRDHLLRETIVHAMQRIGPTIVLADPGSGSRTQRIQRFVDFRLRIYLEVGSITRAAKIASVTNPAIAEQFIANRALIREQFLEHFDAELRHLDEQARSDVAVIAELSFQFDSMEYLWLSTGGDIEEMRRLLVDLTTAWIDRWAPHGAD